MRERLRYSPTAAPTTNLIYTPSSTSTSSIPRHPPTTQALADVDSGYLNGEESSSELSSEKEELEVDDSGLEVR